MSKKATTPSFTFAPDSVPVLGRGRHRSPRRGACFMEFASFLAGERWSDHPNCTHPTLARLARLVNDRTSDSERSHLAVMIPSVVGLVAPGGRQSVASERLELTIAALAASAALPISSESRQRALAVTVLRCTERLAAACALTDGLKGRADVALAAAPQATRWARHQIAGLPARVPQASPIAADAMIVLATTGIAEACAADTDATLRDLLATAIDAAQEILLPAVPSEVGRLQTV